MFTTRVGDTGYCTPYALKEDPQEADHSDGKKPFHARIVAQKTAQTNV